MTKYRIQLTKEERETLLEWVQKGVRKAKHIQIAHILLNSDENVERKREKYISSNYHVSVRTIERVRKRFCEEGMGIFEVKPRKPRSDKKIDARVEAHLISILCQKPEGREKWKLQMLADKLVELQIVEHISTTMVGKLLKKMNLSLSNKNNG